MTYLSRANHTAKEAAALGAPVGTWKWPEGQGPATVHAYVGWGFGDNLELACGMFGLGYSKRYKPETLDAHGGLSAITCGRCRRVLGEALEAA